LKKKAIAGDTVKDQLRARARDRVHTFLLAEGTIRGVFINGTRMVNEMRANFEYGILETYVAGQAYLAGGLMSANLKGNDRLVMTIDCSGPIKGLCVEVNAFGEIRGYLKRVPIPVEKPMEDFDLSPFFGSGFLTMTKYLEDMKQPYTGQVILAHGNMAKDLAHYFYTSEQTPTVFVLSIKFDSEGLVIGAGGLFLQAMPGASDKDCDALEDIISKLPSPGALMAEKQDPQEIIKTYFQSFGPKFLIDERIEFFCRCNKEKIANYISILPMDDLRDIAENGPFPLETRCHNCNTVYHYTKEDIMAIFEKRKH
jgi:molecular chaperone Hsp33